MPISSKDHLEKVSLERQKLDQEAMSIETVNLIVKKIDDKIKISGDDSIIISVYDELGEHLNNSKSLRQYINSLYNSYGWGVGWSLGNYLAIYLYPITPEQKPSRNPFWRIFK